MQVKSRQDSYRALELVRDSCCKTSTQKSCARAERSYRSKALRWGQGEVPSLRMAGVEAEHRGRDRSQAGQQFSCLTLCSITGSPLSRMHRDLESPLPKPHAPLWTQPTLCAQPRTRSPLLQMKTLRQVFCWTHGYWGSLLPAHGSKRLRSVWETE